MAEPRVIAIISAGIRVGSTRRLHEVLGARGHRVHLLVPEELQIVVSASGPELLHRGQPLPLPDAVIPRIPTSKTFLGVSLLTQFEEMGVYCLNSAAAIANARNKLRTLQKLSRHGIPLPETVYLPARSGGGGEDIARALARVGSVPAIIKLIDGTQGVGVMLGESIAGATAILETLRKTGHDVLVQRFVAESRGRDIRALVVGDRVVAAVRRVAQGSEFRSNVHRGSRAESCPIEPNYARTAVEAAQILGLGVAGVDMLESEAGPMVMEVNGSPSLAGMEESTGLDLTTPVVDFLEQTLARRGS